MYNTRIRLNKIRLERNLHNLCNPKVIIYLNRYALRMSVYIFIRYYRYPQSYMFVHMELCCLHKGLELYMLPYYTIHADFYIFVLIFEATLYEDLWHTSLPLIFI